MKNGLSHTDSSGKAQMVDVGGKEVTRRIARARGLILMKRETLSLIVDGNIPKGDVFATARIAGIQAAKRTFELIPLCHPLPVDSITVDLTPDNDTSGVSIESEVKCNGRTGVEMEALTAVAAAALTIYDMCKSVDREMQIGKIELVYKSGGKSGEFRKE